jgi:hydroxyacylglutathione hydrolase
MPTSSTPSKLPAISAFTLGPYATNCYIVAASAPDGGEVSDQPCWIIDASFLPEPIVNTIRDKHLRPEAIILTHAHVDHIAGVAELRRAFPGIPVWMHSAEREWLSDPVLNLSAMWGLSITAPGPDRLLSHAEVLTLAGMPWRVLHTPGHSPGSISLVHDFSHTAIVGDALFNGSIGRTDFPGSSFDQLAASIRTHLYTLASETRVLPGHGPITTIGAERLSNPFVRG